MVRASYRGPVHTLEQALLADMPVRVTCAECGHFRQMHAFELTQKVSRKPKLRPLNLWEPVAGFRCGRCRHSVRAVVSAVQGGLVDVRQVHRDGVLAPSA